MSDNVKTQETVLAGILSRFKSLNGSLREEAGKQFNIAEKLQSDPVSESGPGKGEPENTNRDLVTELYCELEYMDRTLNMVRSTNNKLSNLI